VEEKKNVEDPFRLFEKNAMATAPGGMNPVLPPVDNQGAAPDMPKTTPAADDMSWKSGLVKPLFPARPVAIPPPVSKSGRPSDERKGGAFLRRLLEPVAAKTRVPVLAWEILMVLAILGGLAAAVLSFQKPAYQLTENLPALRPARIEVGQVVELDITSYLDLEGKIRQIGFVPLTRLSVPEIPSPNFFSVYLNPASKTYGILLKVPGSNTPRLSFVNILSNGTWLSTNGWASKDQELEKLNSESGVKEEPAALWAHHQKRLDQAVQSGLSVPSANEWRFICALSDHLRWFMAHQDIPAYKAAFEDWF
jgi:hypothetical protein